MMPLLQRAISYLRVSTSRQGASGLGLGAQRRAVHDYLSRDGWQLVAEVIEIESGSRSNRPKLTAALQLCRVHNATLIIAKLDRLSRNAAFLLGLQQGGVKFLAADMPQANEMVVGIMAVVAQAERSMISERTKAALAIAKKRGQKLGNPKNLRNQELGRLRGREARSQSANRRAADLSPMIQELVEAGANSYAQIALELNRAGIPAARGGDWSATQVGRVLIKMAGVSSTTTPVGHLLS
jgi:DNA invertase Pin-like site-specific DNA recombinase